MVEPLSKPFLKMLACCAFFAASVWPSTGSAVPSFLNDVDFIDASFGAGGGSVTKSLTGGPDDAWIAFAATAGDLVSVTLTTINAGFSAAVVFDPADGSIDLFDRANTVLAPGAGLFELVIQSGPFTVSGNPMSYDILSGQTGTLTLPIATTGQYAVAVTCFMEMCSQSTTQPGSFRVSISGNTVAIPEAAALVLYSLGLACLGMAGLGLTRSGASRFGADAGC